MPVYVVKVTEKISGDWLPPIVCSASDEDAAVSIVSQHPWVSSDDKVEAKGVPSPKVQQYFGEAPPDGACVFRIDFEWSPEGDEPRMKPPV